jgi:hypothetical protein
MTRVLDYLKNSRQVPVGVRAAIIIIKARPPKIQPDF